MNKMLKNLVLISLLLAFAAVSIAAEKKERTKKPTKGRATASKRVMPAKAMEQMLKKDPEIDKDKDGKISKDEMAAYRKTMMKKRSKELLKKNPEIDKDKDGKISREEMMAFNKANPRKRPGTTEKRDPWAVPTPEQAKRILKRRPEADKNKDGKLDKKEMDALKKEFMNRPVDPKRAKEMLEKTPKMDANKDGKLTMGEVQQWRTAQMKAAEKAKNADASARKAKGRVPGEKQLARILKNNPKADTDKDGKLSAGEYKALRKAQAAENKEKREKAKKVKGDKKAPKKKNK